MPYVSRDEAGKINGVYANEQPGCAEEFLPDDDPELVVFLNSQPEPPPSVEDEVLYDHENRIRGLEGLPPLSRDEFAKARG